MHETALSLPVVLPEAVLALGTLALVLYGALRGERSYSLVTEIAVALLGVVFLIVVWKSRPMGITFYGAFADDPFTRFMSGLALIGSLVTLLLSLEFMRREQIAGFEFPVLILLSTLGMLMLIAANDFIALYLGLELMSLALYVIAAYRRHDLRATEAGLKYFVLGALSSGMLLYGASLIYGYAGSVTFSDVAAAVHDHHNLGVLFGLVFVLAGLAFKISAVPFHMWTPDVYEGAPTPVTTFFASAPKIAAMAVLVRVVFSAFPGISGDWRQILAFVSIASMGLGAFAAIGQTNYQAADGLFVDRPHGLRPGRARRGHRRGRAERHRLYVDLRRHDARDLRRDPVDASQRQERSRRSRIWPASPAPIPTMAFFLAAMMFSLAGVPPLAGFFAKFYVFAAAIKAGLYGLAVIGVLASAVGAYYYLRIVKLMYFDEPAKAFDRPGLVAAQRARGGGGAHSGLCVRPLAADRCGDGGGANALLTFGATRGAARFDWRVDRLDAIDSTNEEARRRAVAGDPGRLWIVAGEQSAGRGRKGRSLGFAERQSPRERAHDRSLPAGALAPARIRRRSRARPRDGGPRGAAKRGSSGRTISSSEARNARVFWSRVARLPIAGSPAWSESGSIAPMRPKASAIRPPCSSATTAGRSAPPTSSSGSWSGLTRRSTSGPRATDSPTIRAAWLARAAGVGTIVRIDTAQGRREGAFEGLDADGRLLFRGEGGVEAIEAADLWISPAPEGGPLAGPPGSLVREGPA